MLQYLTHTTLQHMYADLTEELNSLRELRKLYPASSEASQEWHQVNRDLSRVIQQYKALTGKDLTDK